MKQVFSYHFRFTLFLMHFALLYLTCSDFPVVVFHVCRRDIILLSKSSSSLRGRMNINL